VTILERVLHKASLYNFSRQLIGASKEMSLLVDRTITGRPIHRVLDFGCGNGRLVPYLPNVEYVGVDNNPHYIDAATAEHAAASATFICADLNDLEALGIPHFDAVISLGVLHHLPDEVAERALAAAVDLLNPGGSLITMDPCFHPDQSSVARVLMAMDRGRFVRHPNDYRRLVESAGLTVEQQIWSDVYKFPYTHCVQVAAVPA